MILFQKKERTKVPEKDLVTAPNFKQQTVVQPRYPHCEAKPNPHHQDFSTAQLHFPLSISPEVVADTAVFVDQVLAIGGEERSWCDTLTVDKSI